jgi:hypothetical protein
VCFSEGMSAGDEGDGLLVVHGHPCKGLANIPGGGERVGLAVGSFRVDIESGPSALLRVGFRVLGRQCSVCHPSQVSSGPQ